MMNQPLRRVDPLGRSASSTPLGPSGASPDQPIRGSAWPISGGSVRAIVDTKTLAVTPSQLFQNRRGLERRVVVPLEQRHDVGFPDALERVPH
jgi:hypothetical protein